MNWRCRPTGNLATPKKFLRLNWWLKRRNMPQSSFLPLHWEGSRLFRILTPLLLKVEIFLPLFGFFFSVFWSFFFNFEKTTWTHCEVKNYLPSISAAFNYPPSSYVWRICISFHASMRLLNVFVYYHHNRRNISTNIQVSRCQSQLALLAALANFLEIICLVALTSISSSDNKNLHVISFSSFVFFFVVYSSVTCLLHSGMQKESEGQIIAWKWKKVSWITNMTSLLLAAYFYQRHNKYCEQYMYTMFALCEYVFVLSNIAFHFALRYDFEDYHFCYEADNESPVNLNRMKHQASIKDF